MQTEWGNKKMGWTWQRPPNQSGGLEYSKLLEMGGTMKRSWLSENLTITVFDVFRPK